LKSLSGKRFSNFPAKSLKSSLNKGFRDFSHYFPTGLIEYRGTRRSAMDKPDARHLPIETQNYLRQQAIRLREQGKQVKDISECLGVHSNTVWEWWWEYEHHG
jgi:DNA-binding NarL/FixJ family response regulator